MNVWIWNLNRAKITQSCHKIPKGRLIKGKVCLSEKQTAFLYSVASPFTCWSEPSAWVEVRTLSCIIVSFVTCQFYIWVKSGRNQHPCKKDMFWLPIHVEISTPAKRTCFGCRFKSKSEPQQNGHVLTVFQSFCIHSFASVEIMSHLTHPHLCHDLIAIHSFVI